VELLWGPWTITIPHKLCACVCAGGGGQEDDLRSEQQGGRAPEEEQPPRDLVPRSHSLGAAQW
jgi:hypothetical protein